MNLGALILFYAWISSIPYCYLVVEYTSYDLVLREHKNWIATLNFNYYVNLFLRCFSLLLWRNCFILQFFFFLILYLCNFIISFLLRNWFELLCLEFVDFNSYCDFQDSFALEIIIWIDRYLMSFMYPVIYILINVR